MQTDVPFLTRALDKLPIYSTKEMSNIFCKEKWHTYVQGTINSIEQDKEPMVYIDDFEGSSSSYDLKGSPQTWKLASTPKGATDKSGNILFPEADQFNNFAYGFNRAKLSWYNVDPSFFQKSQSPEAVYNNKQVLSNHYVRPIFNPNYILIEI
ncbi:MAG: hypothetical protein R2836_06905 [Chitinophagales bacterium]